MKTAKRAEQFKHPAPPQDQQPDERRQHGHEGH